MTDYRLPENRRETFKKFYAFHNKYKAHPGFVYAAFPYMKEKLEWDQERLLWACFLNGVCQNVVTTQTLIHIFPQVPQSEREVQAIHQYVQTNWERLEWDMDRKYTKAHMDKIVQSYVNNLAGQTQEDFFDNLCPSTLDWKHNFRNVWNKVLKDFYSFGRLATFSYLEYLAIAGVWIDCDSLFLEDINGSKSHRNGLCKVLGRDDLDWHDTINPSFDGNYAPHMSWLMDQGEILLKECQKEYPQHHASYFTLESTLCCYKSWFRPDRRYPGVYLDMHYKRIKRAEAKWGSLKDFSLQWEMRKEILPAHLRLEDNPHDPTHLQAGLSKEKQNHFRLTGEPIMMDEEYPEFKNGFNDRYHNQFGGIFDLL